jgi:hypothetical protein
VGDQQLQLRDRRKDARAVACQDDDGARVLDDQRADTGGGLGCDLIACAILMGEQICAQMLLLFTR